MSVTEVSDGQIIEPNHVYVLPPGRDMTIEADTLVLQPRARQALHRPIDLFLRSLAADRDHQAIGVILSGTATDGTLGVRAIKGASGITFAQDDSARQTSMPHSTIADGFVDFVLPPDQIAAELVRISRLPRALAAPTRRPSMTTRRSSRRCCRSSVVRPASISRTTSQGPCGAASSAG